MIKADRRKCGRPAREICLLADFLLTDFLLADFIWVCSGLFVCDAAHLSDNASDRT